MLNDFEVTKQSLSRTAGSLKLCDNPKLKALGYRRMNFLSHRYFMLYRLEGMVAIVDNIFHEYFVDNFHNSAYSSKVKIKYSD